MHVYFYRVNYTKSGQEYVKSGLYSAPEAVTTYRKFGEFINTLADRFNVAEEAVHVEVLNFLHEV